MTTLTNKSVGLTATRSARNNNNNRALLFSSSRRRDQKNPRMMMRVHPQSCERFRHHHHHHHHHRHRRGRRHHRRIIIACESSSFGDAENALVVFAALVASRVVASNAHDDDDGKAGVFASAVVAPTWIVRWCRGDRARVVFATFVGAKLFAVRAEPFASAMKSRVGSVLIEYVQLGMFVAFAPKRWMDAARSDWRVLALATAFVCAALWKEMNGGKSRSLSHVIEFVKDKSGHKGDIIKDKLVNAARVLPLAVSATLMLAKVFSIHHGV